MGRGRFIAASVTASASLFLPIASPVAAHVRESQRQRSVSDLIVPFRSIAGFTTGLTLKQIEARLGKPDRTAAFNGRVIFARFDRFKLGFAFDPNKRRRPVDEIRAFSRRYHTPEGIRVGSSMAQVRQAYPSAFCDVDCTMSSGTPGAAGTHDMIFDFHHGQVDVIVLDVVEPS